MEDLCVCVSPSLSVTPPMKHERLGGIAGRYVPCIPLLMFEIQRARRREGRIARQPLSIPGSLPQMPTTARMWVSAKPGAPSRSPHPVGAGNPHTSQPSLCMSRKLARSGTMTQSRYWQARYTKVGSELLSPVPKWHINYRAKHLSMYYLIINTVLISKGKF